MREASHGEPLGDVPKREKQARVIEGPLIDSDWEAILAAPKLSGWDRKLIQFFQKRKNEFADAYEIATFMREQFSVGYNRTYAHVKFG